MLNLSKGFQCMYILNILVSKFASSSCSFKIKFTQIFNKEGIIMKINACKFIIIIIIIIMLYSAGYVINELNELCT